MALPNWMMAPGWAIGEPGAPDRREAPAETTATRLPSFAEVHARYFDFVWSSVRRFGVGPAAIDDVVQKVFIVIHEKLPSVERPERLRSWIYGIVRRTAGRHFRSERAAESVETSLAWLLEVRAPGPATPEELTEQAETVELLAGLLAELDEPKREVFILAELEELSAPENRRGARDPAQHGVLAAARRSAAFRRRAREAHRARRGEEAAVSELTPEARALLGAGRKVLRPSDADRARSVAALRAELGDAAFLDGRGPTPPATAHTALWVTSAVAAGAIVAAWLVLRPAKPMPSSAPGVTSAPSATATTLPAPSDPSGAVSPTPAITATDLPAKPAAAGSARRSDHLAEEVRLLTRAAADSERRARRRSTARARGASRPLPERLARGGATWSEGPSAVRARQAGGSRGRARADGTKIPAVATSAARTPVLRNRAGALELFTETSGLRSSPPSTCRTAA